MSPEDSLRRAAALAARAGGLWLDSSAGGRSWLACEPALWVVGRGDALAVLDGPVGDRGWRARFEAADPGTGEPFERLAAVARAWRTEERSSGFCGGFAGYLSYDLGRRFEQVPAVQPDDGEPDFVLGLYDGVLRLGPSGEPTAQGPDGERQQQLWLAGGEDLGPLTVGAEAEPTPELTQAEHAERVEAVRELIRDGSVYQANLTLRFSAPAPHPRAALATYLRLRGANPAPWGGYLDLPGCRIASASPESFLELSGGTARSRPIKGTSARARGGADRVARRQLLASEKDRSELAMIVDLVRNDLGRVCEPGSVTRGERIVAEAHPTVWHLVGDVVGRLAAGSDGFDLVRAAFPPGSCIGAPKIRAMAELERLERSRRGLYTGAIGWFGFDGQLGLNVAIRTLRFRDGVVDYGVGGGIVWDSQPDSEWREALLKGRALAQALRPARAAGLAPSAGDAAALDLRGP